MKSKVPGTFFLTRASSLRQGYGGQVVGQAGAFPLIVFDMLGRCFLGWCVRSVI